MARLEPSCARLFVRAVINSSFATTIIILKQLFSSFIFFFINQPVRIYFKTLFFLYISLHIQKCKNKYKTHTHKKRNTKERNKMQHTYSMLQYTQQNIIYKKEYKQHRLYNYFSFCFKCKTGFYDVSQLFILYHFSVQCILEGQT